MKWHKNVNLTVENIILNKIHRAGNGGKDKVRNSVIVLLTGYDSDRL